MNYENWREIYTREYPDQVMALPIPAPPCANCKWWKPMTVVQNHGQDGIRLCWKSDGGMEHDFSCFEQQ